MVQVGEKLPDAENETDDSMLDNSEEAKGNEWQRQASANKAPQPKKQLGIAKLDLDFELLNVPGSNNSDSSSFRTEASPVHHTSTIHSLAQKKSKEMGQTQ